MGGAAAALWLAAAPSIRVMGATSLIPLVKAAVPAFAARHPGVAISVSAGGSYAGLLQAAQGHVEIGMSDLPPAELALPLPGRLEAVPLGCVPVVVVVHPDVGVRRLSRQRLADILAGRVRNWAQVGGAAQPVVVVTRQLASGARAVMQRALGLGAFSPDAVVQLSNGAVLRTVADTPGAVGYVEAAFLRPGVQVLGVGPYDYPGSDPRRWPFLAPVGLYLAPGAPPAAYRFARFVADWGRKGQFGIVPCGESERG